MDEDELRSGLVKLHGLLDPVPVPWAVAAGSAVYLYTRSRPPVDLDVLVRPQDLSRAAGAFRTQVSAVITAFGEADKIEVDGIDVSGLLTVRAGGRTFLYSMDDEMVQRTRRVEYGAVEAPVLAPEDVIAFKAVLQRGPEQGKHDLEDIDALVKSVSLDRDYLLRRLGVMDAIERATPILSVRGLWPLDG